MLGPIVTLGRAQVGMFGDSRGEGVLIGGEGGAAAVRFGLGRAHLEAWGRGRWWGKRGGQVLLPIVDLGTAWGRGGLQDGGGGGGRHGGGGLCCYPLWPWEGPQGRREGLRVWSLEVGG